MMIIAGQQSVGRVAAGRLTSRAYLPGKAYTYNACPLFGT